MDTTVRSELAASLAEIRAAGLYKTEPQLASPQSANVRSGGQDVLNFCANNYLGLAYDPRIVAAAKASLDEWGFGMASVRFICGTQSQHVELEDKNPRSSALRPRFSFRPASTPTAACSKCSWTPGMWSYRTSSTMRRSLTASGCARRNACAIATEIWPTSRCNCSPAVTRGAGSLSPTVSSPWTATSRPWTRSATWPIAMTRS